MPAQPRHDRLKAADREPQATHLLQQGLDLGQRQAMGGPQGADQTGQPDPHPPLAQDDPREGHARGLGGRADRTVAFVDLMLDHHHRRRGKLQHFPPPLHRPPAERVATVRTVLVGVPHHMGRRAPAPPVVLLGRPGPPLPRPPLPLGAVGLRPRRGRRLPRLGKLRLQRRHPSLQRRILRL